MVVTLWFLAVCLINLVGEYDYAHSGFPKRDCKIKVLWHMNKAKRLSGQYNLLISRMPVEDNISDVKIQGPCILFSFVIIHTETDRSYRRMEHHC